MPIRAVTFDFWNTIAAEPVRGAMQEARLAAVLGACRDRGVEAEDERVEASLTAVVRGREEAWAEGRHVSPAEGAALLAAALGVDGEAGEAIGAAFLEAGRGSRLALAPEIGATLGRLREEGIALGIVCDAGFTGGAILREFLEAEGLLGHFSGWGFSDEVGTYKPAPEIFAAALGMIGAAPGDAVHVGDLRRTDIAGARGFGMGSVRYRGLVDDPEPGVEADFVIDSHRELPALLAEID
ncbi:MAG: HAD family hydrolase [Actinobacteria bacterium]|nr:HAD family hydrolase [Actinomycetota bacterium]